MPRKQTPKPDPATLSWTTACKDWEQRIVGRRSLIPCDPLFPGEAERALEIFKSLRVVDLPGKPTFGECCDQWVFDFVSVIFGAYDPETGQQKIRDFMLLISKKNTKSTIAAGIMLTALILNWREEEELLILAPTVEVALNSFKPAAAMVRNDPELNALLHVQDHIKTITHRTTKAALKVVAADSDTVSGKKAGRILVDELWLFGKRVNADGMLMEATGGQVSRDEGFTIYLTTQSDEPPAGVFKEKLDYFRDVRDGKVLDKKSLGILYEFPDSYVKDSKFTEPDNFYITNPNLGRSVSAEWIEDQLRKELAKADGSAKRKFLAKHLNVEIGMNLRADRWAGAEFWTGNPETKISNIDKSLTFEGVLERSEVVVAGIDGGGLDDLLGLTITGRCKMTRKWLQWSHAWCYKIVLDRRKDIASVLLDFQKQGDLTIVEKPGQDVTELADYIVRIADANLLPEKNSVGVDVAGINDIVDALTAPGRDLTLEQIVGVSQGWKLGGAIKTMERKLAGGEILHNGSPMMAWCVGNARVVQQSNSIMITKQMSGTAKIDPLMAAFNANSLMGLNPTSRAKKYQVFFV